MSPLFAESPEKVYGDLIADLASNTNLTRFSRGSLVRELALAISKKMGSMWGQFDLNIAQAFVDGAEGKFLRLIGSTMGVDKLGETLAKASATSQNFKFYVSIGTFGTVNGGSSITIPAGTIVSTGPGGTGTTYRTTAINVLDSASSEQFVAIEATDVGASSNVGRNQLVYHNFIEYDDVNDNTLLVANDGAIVTGRDGESDVNYRYRIVNQVFASQNANETAVRLAALSVPGVADVNIMRFFKGIGTAELLIKSTVPEVSSTLLDNVSDVIGNVTGLGELISARGPLETGVSLNGVLTLKRRISAQEETDLISAVTNNLVDYINSLDIAEDLVINEMVERVLSTSEVIKNIGITSKPFDNLYVYKQSVVNGGKTRQSLLTDYSPEADERVIVETVNAGSTPILITIS